MTTTYIIPLTAQRYVRTLYVAWKLLLRGHQTAAFRLSDHATIALAPYANSRTICACTSALCGLPVDNPDARARWVSIMEGA
jgi:hypothetical protein